MVNSVNSMESYPQSFIELVNKPQSTSPQALNPSAEGDSVELSGKKKMSKGKKIAIGTLVAAAAVLTTATALHKIQPKFFTKMLDPEATGIGSKIAKGVDAVGGFISSIPSRIAGIFRKESDDMGDQRNWADDFDDFIEEEE